MNKKYIVNVDILAKYFNVTPRTIQLWSNDPLDPMPKEKRGQYDLIKCAKWRIQRLEKELDELKRGEQTLNKLEIEEKQLSNIQRKIKIEADLKKLVHIDAVKIARANEMIAIARQLDILTNKLLIQLKSIDINNEIELEKAIKKNIDEIRIQMTNELNIIDDFKEIDDEEYAILPKDTT